MANDVNEVNGRLRLETSQLFAFADLRLSLAGTSTYRVQFMGAGT